VDEYGRAQHDEQRRCDHAPGSRTKGVEERVTLQLHQGYGVPHMANGYQYVSEDTGPLDGSHEIQGGAEEHKNE
jgi:hypothetical protein